MNNNNLSENMLKSTTNRSLTNQPDSGIVSRSGLGKRVIVNGHFGGVLRYMGQVAGKEGIFCGIELDQPVGKNDGTHEGAFYFGCRPGHGIFAPCHKVQMEAIRRQGGGKASYIAKAEKSLSRSAMPSLSNDMPSTSSNIFQMPMDWSLMSMSTVSNNSDSSFMIKNDNNNIDLMANSQATYTVFESDCPMLSDLELSESSLIRLDEEEDDYNNQDDRTAILGWIMNDNGFSSNRTYRQDESIILDGPSLGMDLPIITSPEQSEEEEEDDDIQTPMAETKNFNNGIIILKSENKQNRSHLILEGLEQQQQQQKNKRKNNKKYEEENKLPNGLIAFMTDEENNNVNENACYMRTNVVSSRNKHNPQREKGGEGGEIASKSIKEEKTRISIFQSIPMPTQNLSAAARAAKPKQPSKAQLVMEKIKAGMEAEKHVAKKEVRSKLFSGIVTPNNKGDKRQDIVGKSKSSTNVKMNGVDKSPSRQHSEDVTTPTSTHGLRQHMKSPSVNKLPSATRSIPRTNVLKPHGTISTPTITSSTPSSKQPPLSSFGRINRQVLSSKENTVTKENSNNKILKNNILTTKTSTNKTIIKTNLVNNKDELVEQQKLVEKLQNSLDKEKKNRDVFIIVCKNLNEKNDQIKDKYNKLLDLLEQNNLKYESDLAKLETKWKENLQHANNLHKNEIDDVRSLLASDHQNKLEQLQNEYQIKFKEYEEQIINLKSKLDQQAEKHRIQLCQSENDRIKSLSNELTSREFELQLRNRDLTKLRTENRDLLYKVEQIAEKDGQINKLENKNEELRDEVNRLKKLEKSLINQLEIFRHERDQALHKSKEIEREKEVLEYQLTDEFKSPRSSKSTPLNFNNRTPINTASTERPNSSCLSSLGRHHQPFEPEMAKSVDSALSLVKCYQQEGRSKMHNTPTKIYTPRECYELPDNPPQLINFDQNDISGNDSINKQPLNTIDFEQNDDCSITNN